MDGLTQVLVLLGLAVAVVVMFQRLRLPSSLGYLLVGVVLGPHTAGPVLALPQIGVLAEFGIVFLLFTIGLNFSLPQIYALRHQLLGLGSGQVVFTTAVVALVGWLVGLPPAMAFVMGAVFAQSSTTIIGKQLVEQGEDNSRHGRLGLAMSVFQDVTAVPFVVVIPVLGMSVGALALGTSLGWALAKAVLAFALVFLVGRRLLRPLFHVVAQNRSPEVFSLTVLLVALLAAWTTHSLGLSLAFGAFLAGMMLGETEFRHQIEAAIRPFRDVLLGLFFVGVGFLFDLSALPRVWPWALLGAALLLVSKTVLVALMVRRTGIDRLGAWRTGLLLAVGGEFGFALLATALVAGVVDEGVGQVVLMAVLFSMIAGPFLIRHNLAIARLLTRAREEDLPPVPPAPPQAEQLRGHVIICGYGRIGQGVARFLREEKIAHVALDHDPVRVRAAHAAGEPVHYGDCTDAAVLEGLGLDRARLLVISHNELEAALKVLAHVRVARPTLPVMVRTRDEAHVAQLLAAGAREVVPETQEAALMIASQALLWLEVPPARVMSRMEQERHERYRLLKELYPESPAGALLQLSVEIAADSAAVGRASDQLDWSGVAMVALVRAGSRSVPQSRTRLQAGDVVVLQGPAQDVQRAEQMLRETHHPQERSKGP
ncbi:MAG: cation:proton antiporter [Hylemonella sp.]|nr:cation:proton antiporter [Hylemonella sp.]